ncbi:uncharacterized protein B0T15DRAFT_522460 [Chaetomium strumarium]|uniref:Uncharacterized protein n=1 Tax=Chaetomium strumarium TaxID=1170767 RepID=A0AAJ0GX57_9PEZI|nr:hypothetical protein B0T15DRAFT_522460 [Chaetomium strumarium]
MDDDPFRRRMQRRGTTPGRIYMDEPVPPPPRQPTSFLRQEPTQNAPSLPESHGPHYVGGGPPHAAPTYYRPAPVHDQAYYYHQPHATQFVDPRPRVESLDVYERPLSPIDRRRQPLRAPSVQSRGFIRPRSQSPTGPSREKAPSGSPSSRHRQRRYTENYHSDGEGDGEDGDDSTNEHIRRVPRIARESQQMPEYLEEADEFGNPLSPTVYSFTPSRISHTASTQLSSDADDEPLEEAGGDAAAGGTGGRKEPDHRGLRLSHVFQSQYNGDYTLGGSHGVKLAAVSSSSMRYQPLFRWLHCTRTLMDFDDFSREAARVPDLTPVEQKGIRDLLVRVQRKFVKTVQTASGRSVRHMEPACIQQILPPDSASSSRRTVTWICLPYFTLEKYSGLQGAPENSSAFPIETLLQAKFSRASKERDMRQAVCQSKDIPAGLCFHVAQIWCLIVGNSLLFTYSRMTEETLRAHSVEISVPSFAMSPDSRPLAVIAVSYKQAVLWSIPLEECQTWLDFQARFWEFWPQRLQFFHRKRPVTGGNWPRIWNLAKHTNTKIVLEMRIGPHPTPPPAGVLIPTGVGQATGKVAKPGSQPQSQSQSHPEGSPRQSRMASEKLPPSTPNWKSRSMPESPDSVTLPAVSIFSCLPGVTHPDYAHIDEEALDDHLREVEDYLLCRTPFSDRRTYAACPEATRGAIYSDLEQGGIELSKLDDVPSKEQWRYETQLDIFNAADIVFKFFFPPDVEMPTIRKFWGALDIIITNGVRKTPSEREPPRRTGKPLLSNGTLRTTRLRLRRLCAQLLAFNDIFSDCGRLEQSRIAVPNELVEGWIHLLMALVYLPIHEAKSDRLFDDANGLIHNGMAAVIRSLSDKSLLDSSVVLPQELLSLISLKLLRDSTMGMPDIIECYSGCLDELEADIASRPSDRSREHRISLLNEEISVVKRVISVQASVFESLFSFAQETETGAVNAAPRMHSGNRARDVPGPVRIVDRVNFRGRHRAGHRYHAAEYKPYYPRARAGAVRSRSYPDEDPEVHYYYETPTFGLTDSATHFQLDPTDPGGYRILLLTECIDFLSGRERDFSDFRDWALSLEQVNRNKIDTTKDRHDNAIYAFTIVTIIFLPLSAVASIFGINTRDVRDMELDQWAYWATAVPVTVLVIFLGLLWTGELGNILGWAQSFGQRRGVYKSLPSGGSYRRLDGMEEDWKRE